MTPERLARGPNEFCTDCGRRMVWQRETGYPGAWMCPNCVLRAREREQAEVERLGRDLAACEKERDLAREESASAWRKLNGAVDAKLNAQAAALISEPTSGMWALERAIAASEARVKRLREALMCLLPGLALDVRNAGPDDDIEAMRCRVRTITDALAETEDSNA